MIDVLETIKSLHVAGIVTVIEIIVILVGVALSMLVLRARARMKRAHAARMLSVWLGAIFLRLDQHAKGNIDLTDVILPTPIISTPHISPVFLLRTPDVQRPAFPVRVSTFPRSALLPSPHQGHHFFPVPDYTQDHNFQSRPLF